MSIKSDIMSGGEAVKVVLPQPTTSITYPLWFGGSASCCAVCLTHPLDLVKVRMQTSQNKQMGMVGTFINIVRNDGVLGVYKGLSAGIARQLLYGSTRFAIYETIKDSYAERTNREMTPAVKIAAASAAGFIGGIVGNPADLANVRMQNDSALPPQNRRNYKNVLDAWWRFKQEEGWRGYTKGVWANSLRASMMTACQLGSYDIFKTLLIEKVSLKDNLGTHFTASVMAGFVATTICNPVDVIKSQIMALSGKMSMFQIISNLIRKEGVWWIWRGWTPSFIRLGPHTVATFVFLEQHKRIYRHLTAPKEILGAS